MPKVNRHVIGVKQNKMGGVIYSDNPEYQEVPQIFWRATLWNTTELPVDNTVRGDRAKDVTQREPSENGLTFRALEIPPDIPDKRKHIEILQDVNKKVKQKYPPTPKGQRLAQFVKTRAQQSQTTNNVTATNRKECLKHTAYLTPERQRISCRTVE